MDRGFSEQLLSRLSEFVAGHMGLHFPQTRSGDLERGIRAAARALGAQDAESCAQWLLSAPLTRSQIEILASELTVGETYFFREKRSLEILGEHVLPDLIRSRQESGRYLRIWSAGCCTGEEPYSIAMLLDRIMPNWSGWRLTVLGTDINPLFLRKAEQGVFSEWSFRDAPPRLKEQYFKPVGEHRFEIAASIKDRVTFAYLNLAEDVYPSLSNNTNAMDVIFCRNVLMYFTPERARRVVENFHRALTDGGWLIVSPTETSARLFSAFTPVSFEGAVLYRKEHEGAVASAPLAWSKQEWNTRVDSFDDDESLPSPASYATEPLVSPAPDAAPAQGEEAPPATDAAPAGYAHALALFERGQYSEAVRTLQSTSAVARSADSCALLARSCANLGDLDNALAWAEKAIAADKLNGGLHYLRAVILVEQDSIEAASTALQRALYLDPDFVLAHFAMGNLMLRCRRGEAARRHFSNALALLSNYRDEQLLPYSDGLVAGRLSESILTTLSMHTGTEAAL